ncbi:hypothetical protein TWF694_005342 [Orbilia ellipsospora]|uniref:Ubiquitin-like domain-containing protein n=1 Tax=Orbilia ellipsospora TaxID=2528407 RepID=A0AAV9WU15_9PEZI
MEDLKAVLVDEVNYAPKEQQLFYDGRQLKDTPKGDSIGVVRRLRGGGSASLLKQNAEIGIAAGGLPPPQKPLSAAEYAFKGGNFFKYPEDETDIHGDFSQVKSVGKLAGQLDQNLSIDSRQIEGKNVQESQLSTSKDISTSQTKETAEKPQS